MSSGDMYSEPSYDDVQKDVNDASSNTPTPVSSGSNAPAVIGCLLIIVLIIVLILYFALR